MYTCSKLTFFHAAKALTEEERTTCPDGHGGGVLPGGAGHCGHPGRHLQQSGATTNNQHGKVKLPTN